METEVENSGWLQESKWEDDDGQLSLAQYIYENVCILITFIMTKY